MALEGGSLSRLLRGRGVAGGKKMLQNPDPVALYDAIGSPLPIAIATLNSGKSVTTRTVDYRRTDLQAGKRDWIVDPPSYVKHLPNGSVLRDAIGVVEWQRFGKLGRRYTGPVLRPFGQVVTSSPDFISRVPAYRDIPSDKTRSEIQNERKLLMFARVQRCTG